MKSVLKILVEKNDPFDAKCFINQTIEELNLANQNLGLKGAEKLARLLKQNYSLERLYLQGNNLGNQGTALIVEASANHSNLRELYLQDNQITDTNEAKIVLLVKLSKKLIVLNLANNLIDDSGIKPLAPALRSSIALKELSLHTNRIEDDGIKVLAENVRHSPSLEILNLGNNLITNTGLISIAELIQANTNLRKLYISNNKFSREGFAKMDVALEGNTNLLVLDIYENKIGAENELKVEAIISRNSKIYLQQQAQINIKANVEKMNSADALADQLLSKIKNDDIVFKQIVEEYAQTVPATTKNNNSYFTTMATLKSANPPAKRIEKTRTTIVERYELINKITEAEAKQLYLQTGINVPFESGRNKLKFVLGEGHFGKLRLAYDVELKQFVGVKKIKGDKEIEASKNEGCLQEKLSGCANVMPLLASVDTIGSVGEAVLYQFMPLAGWGNGDSFSCHIKSLPDRKLKDKLIVHVAKSLLVAAMGMHEKNIYHLDIKPSNIVFDKHGTLFLIDFGCAVETKADNCLIDGGYGDIYYYSPERLANLRKHDQKHNLNSDEIVEFFDTSKADSWAIGITLLEFMHNYPFEQVTSCKEALGWDQKYFNDKISQIDVLKNQNVEDYVYVIHQLLHFNPEERLTTKQALQLPIFNNPTYTFQDNEEREAAFEQLKKTVVTNINLTKINQNILHVTNYNQDYDPRLFTDLSINDNSQVINNQQAPTMTLYGSAAKSYGIS